MRLPQVSSKTAVTTGTMSVKLQYFSLSGGNYTSSGQVLNALKAQVGDGVKVEGKSKKIAGNRPLTLRELFRAGQSWRWYM